MVKNEKQIDKEEIASGMILFGLLALILTAIFVNYIDSACFVLLIFIVEVLSVIIGLIILNYK